MDRVLQLDEPRVIAEQVVGSPRTAGEPALSVVVVTHDGEDVYEALGALETQQFQDFETILVDNGNVVSVQRLSAYRLRYLKLDRNTGPDYARNLAAAHSRGKILAFLDDDGLPDSEWTNVVNRELAVLGVVGVRGRVLPKRHPSFAQYVTHYDLGGDKVAAPLLLEGHCAVRRDAFLEVGGFSTMHRAGVGAGEDLSKRLESYGVTLYVPEFILRHDYADSLWNWVQKQYLAEYHSESELVKRVAPESLHPVTLPRPWRIRNWSGLSMLAEVAGLAGRTAAHWSGYRRLKRMGS